MLKSTKSSNQSCQSRASLFRSASMLCTQFGGHALHLYHLRQHGIVAMPLNEVGTTHEGAVLRSASIVMPEIEAHEVDGVRKRWPGKRAFLAQPIHDRLRFLHAS